MISFEQIQGQERALENIQRAYRTNRLPHGLIFAGPVGVGKAMTARALAALFLCENPAADSACGVCASCKLIESETHPDYHVITRALVRVYNPDSVAKDLSTEVMRKELIDVAGRKSNLGKGKVFVVEEAELMNPQAQNACLKTLEEPEGRTLIILLTDQPSSLLATIRSRCQIIWFASLDRSLVRTSLEKSDISKADAMELSELSQGSIGLARRWHEEGVLPHARELSQRLDGLMAGNPSPDLPEWLKTVSEDYAERQMKKDSKASKAQMTRDGLSIYFRLMAQYFRTKLAEEEDAERLECLCGAIDAIVQAESFLDANVNIPLIFQQLVVRLERLLIAASASPR